MNRRLFIKGMAACAAGFGFLKSVVALAVEWPKAVFDSETETDAVKAFFGDTPIAESADVEIKAPLQAENGAVVPIKVSTTLADAESIAITVEKNPVPFVTVVNLQPGSSGGFYSARIKMGETSLVRAYVKAGDKIHMASQEVKVTVGGCGG
ncbi:MAG: thiosulfate oxidation carrier protein SoxY [Arenicellales bacterium]|nr:thiosulfate oxidation carrier protein SoxY [Arenicellales bacterium]